MKRIRTRRRRVRVPEKSIQAEIVTLLQLAGWRVHVIDVIRGRHVQYGNRTRILNQGDIGQPDLLAVRMEAYVVDCDTVPSSGTVHAADKIVGALGRVLYIETKAADGRLSPIQTAFHEVLRREGYVVVVARSWADVVAGAAAEGVAVER